MAVIILLTVSSGCFLCSCRDEPEANAHPDNNYRPSEIEIDHKYTTYKAADGGTLDKNPWVYRYVKPEYPQLARAAGIEGTVTIEVTIDISGQVRDVRILESKITPSMEKNLMEAVRFYKYKPGTRNDKPIICIATHLVIFTLNDDVIPIDVK